MGPFPSLHFKGHLPVLFLPVCLPTSLPPHVPRHDLSTYQNRPDYPLRFYLPTVDSKQMTVGGRAVAGPLSLPPTV